MYRFAFCTFLCSASLLYCNEQTSLEEKVHLKRIAEFWDERDFSALESEIPQFLALYSDSPLRDSLFAMLGDAFFHEGNFEKALSNYETITDRDQSRRVELHRIQCLMQLREYAAVTNRCESLLKSSSLDRKKELLSRFLLAESLFKQAQESNDLDLATKSIHQYDLLKGSDYEEKRLLALSEVYDFLNQPERVASCFMALAELFPRRAEEFQFRAAVMLAPNQPERALDAFKHLAKNHGPRAELAAYNRLLLLFETGKFQTIFEESKRLRRQLAEEKAPLVDLYLGKAYFQLQHFDKAAEMFQAYLEQATPHRRQAILALADCAHHLCDLKLLETAVNMIQTDDRQDPALPELVFLHARIAFDHGDPKKAQRDFALIKRDFPIYAESENFSYDYALALAQTKQWVDAREAFLDFVESYPQSEKANEAWKHLLHCSTQMLGEDANAQVLLLSDLERALKTDFLPKEEKRDYSFFLMKTLYDQENYAAALNHLRIHITEFPTHLPPEQVHLFSAYCHEKIGDAPELFIFHAEEALQTDLPTSDKQELHLKLFNLYLSQENEKEAARHLYELSIPLAYEIKRENLAWLANFFESKVGEEDFPFALSRARQLYGKLLKGSTPDDPTYEQDNFRLARLDHKAGDFATSEKRLRTLIQAQENTQEKKWNLYLQSLKELAIVLEKKDELQSAIALYDKLLTLQPNFPQARLERERLAYSLIPTSQRHAQNPDVIEVLSQLKTLQIKRHLSTEPSHLEAALNYVKIKTELAPKQEKISQELSLLRHIKEEFSSQHDILTTDYHMMRRQDPAKDAVWQEYMNYIDARIHSLETEGINE